MKHSLRSLARAAVALALLALLPAVHAASFTDSAPTLTVDLAASDSVSITSAGTTYSLTLAAGNWTGTDTANVTGTGTATLTVTATGLANFTLIDITDSGAGASVTFADSGANAYSDNFTITLDSTAAATALTFNGTSAFGGNALAVSVDNSVSVSGSASVTATGTGTISLTTTRNIFVGSSATVSTVNGNLTLSANAGGTTTGAFVGVDVSNGLVQVTGSGVLSVTGKGGDGAGGSNYGVLAQGGGDIIGGTSGTMTVSGTGGPSTGSGNIGVIVTDTGSSITSLGANVTINGTGGGSGGASTFNSGVDVGNSFNDGLISAGGSGTVTVIGQGGAGTGGDNYGVRVAGTSSAIITSSGGNVIVTGTGGAGSDFNNGVRVRSSGQITAGGAGTVSVTGTSGSGGGSVNDGVYVLDSGSVITSTGGSVSITGIGSASSAGVKLEDSGAINSGGNFPITITSDSFARVTSGSISAGSGTVTFVQRTAGTLIDVGGADVLTGSPLTLGLTDAELDSVTASTLNIGDANSGAITVSAAISHPNHLSISVASAISIDQSVTMAVNKNFSASTTGTGVAISLPNGTSDLSATGTGTISLTATRNIVVASGASVTTADGNLTLSANAAGTTTGNFIGVDVNGGLVQASGTGVVSVTGQGGNDTGGAQMGVHVRNGGDIIGGTAGTTTVTGTGGASVSASSGNHGVVVQGGTSSITSGGANVLVTGDSDATGTSPSCWGVYVNLGTITAGSSGTVTVNGTGGAGSGGSNWGVLVADPGGVITSGGGAVSVTGQGGGSGASSSDFGVRIMNTAQITAGGSGTVTVDGTGGSGSGGAQHGVSLTSGGDIVGNATGLVTVTGDGGASSGTQNVGVRVDGSGSTITSSGANVQVSGNGGGSGTSIQNIGVFVFGSGAISAGGTGTVSITGNGGTTTTGDQNHGIVVQAAVSSNNGNITFNGTGGGSGTSGINRGVQIGSTASTSIAAGGANTVSLTGTGGSGGASSGNNQGVMILAAGGLTTSVTTAGGTMTINGTPGGATTHGIDIQGGGTSTSITTGGGNLTLIADGMSLSSTALSLNTGAGSATLRQKNNGTAINLGAADSAGTLGLTDTELDYFTATTVNIGDANSGAVTVSAAITHPNHLSISVASAISIDQSVTMALDKNLTIQTTGATATISLPNATSDLTASGTGAISLTSTFNMLWASGSSATVANGNLTLSANAAGTTAGSFDGVSFSGTLTTSGTGDISVTGRGGTTNGKGINLSGGQITSTGTGASAGDITMAGQGGGGGANFEHGILINSSSAVSTVDGDISLTGTAGGAGGNSNHIGVGVFSGSTVSSTGTGAGAGTITIDGTGGGSGNGNHGVDIEFLAATVTSADGNIQITGTAGAGTSSGFVLGAAGSTGTLSSSGTATITVISDTVSISTTDGTLNGGTSTVTLRQETNGQLIDVGGADSGTTLGLSDGELDRVTAGTIAIGDANSGNITVSAAISLDDSVSLANAGTRSITFNNSFTLTGTTKSLTVDSGSGGITIATTAISTTGTQTYQDAVSLTAGPTLTASTVTFNSTVDGGQALTITGNAVFGDGGTDALGGTTALTSVSVSGTTTFNISSAADVFTTGAQTYSGAVTLTLPVVLGSTGSGDITFGSTVNGAQGLTANTGGITRFQGVVGGGTRLASLSTDAGGTTRIETTGISTVGGVSFNDAVVLGADATVDNTTAATIRFFSTVNSDNAGTKRDLTVTTTAGGSVIQFDAAVGGSIPLDVVTINNAALFTTLAAADFSLDGAFSQAGAGTGSDVAGDITTTGDTISFNTSVDLTGNVAFDTTSGTPAGANITFSGAVNADVAGNNRTITLTAGTGGTIDVQGMGATQNLQTFTINSAAAANLRAIQTRSGGISVTATAITLNNNLTTDALAAAGSVTLSGSITLAAAPLTIDTDSTTDGAINFGTLADNGNGAFRTLNLTAGGGAVTFTTSPGALNFEVDGTVAGTSHDRINVTGTINLNNTALTIPNSTIASSIGQTLTLIDNDGTGDAVVGTFNGQAQNSLVTINGASFRISYTGGDGNDVTLTEATDIQVTLTGDDLTVDDASNTADNLTISLNGANVRISDSSKILSAGPGTTQVNANTVDVPLASLSPAGSITLNGNGGNDLFTRNFAGGNIDVPITWNGGAQTVSDTLALTGGGTFALVTHTFASASDGSVAVTGNGLISYTGLEPVTDNLSATDRVFDFTGGAETITLSDNVAADGNMRIDSTLGELVDFANPTTSLTINAGTGDDQITISSVDAGYAGSLTINGDANNDNITITAIAPTISALTTTSETLAALPTLSIGAGGLSLTTSAGAITQTGATTLTVTGTATLAAGAANNITLANVGNNFSTVVVTSGNDVSLSDAGAINLGTSTVSGSLTVNAAGLIDFTGAGASTVGTTMSLTTTAGGITDSGAGTLAVTGTSTLAAGAANNITLNNNNDFTTVAITSGNNVTINDTVANLTFNASTVSGTLTVNVTALNGVLTVSGAITYQGTVTFVADNMAINNTVNGGAGADTVNLRQSTATTLINLGAADAAGTLGLTDAEIDQFIGGGTETINIGDTSSGAITISAAISRATLADFVITTAANNDITFTTGSLSPTATGDVTLTTSGTGAIVSGTLGTDIIGGDISLVAGSGGIGASGNPLALNASTLAASTTGNADQYFAETSSGVVLGTVNAGTGTVFLSGGTFFVGNGTPTTTLTGKLDVSGTLNQLLAANLITGGNASDTVRVRSGGAITIFRTGTTPYSDLFNATVATGRTPPTLDSGSTINWQSAAATTVDLTTFENVNFNGAGPFALSGNTTVTTAGNTMTVSTGSRLNTGAFFVDGAGNFTLQSNGTLGIGSAAGITSAGATGSIQVTGTRSFNASGDYVYNGVALQVTGNGLPVTITTPGSLTINNASNVELTQDTTTDLLVLTSGRFFTENGGGDRLLTTTAPISGGGAGSYVVGRLARSFIVGAQEHVFHIGDAADYAPFDVGFGAGSFTVTTGGTLTARVFPDYGGSTAALHPNLTAGGQPIAGLESTDTILRYWRLTPSGGLAGSYFPAATYANADIQGDETRYVLRRYNDDGLGTMWHLTPNNNRTPGINTVFVDPAGATPVSFFGDYTVGEQRISFYTLSHPNSVGEEINVNFGLTVTPRDYLGGAVLSGHESVTLTYNAYYANSATATANFTFNGSGSPYSGAGAFTTGSQTVTGQGTVRETLDIVVMDGSSRTGILEDLIIGNAPTAALAGTGVRLDGTGYGITDNLGLEFTDESVTVEMWFNVDATGTGGVLFDERGAANIQGFRASWIEAVGPVGGPYEIRLRVWNIPQAINGNNPRTTGLAIGTVTAGGWHHITLRYDKALLRLDGFLDGVKSASFITGDRTTPFEVNASNPVVREGIFFGIGLADDQHLGNGLGFKGDIDELRIWDGARSDAQILDNWTKTVDPASTGLVAYYHFDDGSGSVAEDATSNGFDLAFASLTPPASYTPTWVSSTALSGVAALTYSVEVGETVVITLDGFDPEDTGTLTANVGAVTGSWGVNANLRQYDNTLINAGGVAVTDSARRVKVQGLAGGGPLTFQYTVNNGIANSPAITVTVNVVGATGAPTINASGTIAPASNEDTSPVTITRAQIAAALAAADPAPGPGATIAFRVRSLINGKLQINGTNVVDNSTFITGTAPLNSVTWYPPANVSGIVDAFIVDAYDGSTPTDGQYSANTGIVRVNLTAVNDAPITQVVTTALDFDGVDDYLFTPNLRSAFSNETVTLEVWFRPSTNASGEIVPGAIISERGQNGLTGWRNSVLELLPSGQVKARMWNITAINLGTVDTNNWNHAVVRYDKSTLKITGFLNRVASSTLAGGVGSGDRKAPWEDGRFALHYDIGAANDQNLGSGAAFKGQVAEFRIWTIARTDESILGSYLGADLTNERGLLAWYKLDEAVGPAGATTPDDSVNNHDANLFGTAQFVNVHPMIAVAGSYVIKLPAIDVEDETMTWVVNTTAAQLNGGKMYHNLGGAVGAEIPTDAAIALFPVANGTVYYVPPAGGPADHDIYFYVADASGAVSTTASVKISVTAALRRAGDYAGGGAGEGAGLSYAGGSGAGMSSGGSGVSGAGSAGGSGYNLASLVQVVTPADGSGWASSDTATVIIAVSPLLGQAAFVEVFADGESLGLAVPGEAGIWALSVNGVPPGTYQLRAVAVDSVGTAILSLPVTVTVSP